jgi:hypothetical protein
MAKYTKKPVTIDAWPVSQVLDDVVPFTDYPRGPHDRR